MIDIEYVKEFNRLSRFSPESRLFVMERDYIASMATLGKLKDLKRGLNKYFRNKKAIGEVEVPEDVFYLLTVPNIDIEVQFFGDVPSGNTGTERGLRIRIANYRGVMIEISYGLVSGVLEICVHSFAALKCKVPEGYSLCSFAAVLNNNQLEDFVLRFCDGIPQYYIDKINNFGLGD